MKVGFALQKQNGDKPVNRCLPLLEFVDFLKKNGVCFIFQLNNKYKD